MSPSLALARRNVLIYLRDRQSVFFSLMGVLIVVLLYLLFLRDMLISSYPDFPGMNRLMDAWVLSGIMGIVPVTTCAGCLQPMVEDRCNGRVHDILVTPMTPWGVASGYILSTFAVGSIMSLTALILCIAYLAVTGCLLTASGVLTAAALIVPSALSASVIVYTMASCVRSTGAFSGLFVVVSVMIGFLAGIYMPMGTMPDAMQTVGTLVPASHMAALFRNALATGHLDSVFAGSTPDVLAEFRLDMGFDLELGGFAFTDGGMLLYALAVTAAAFAAAAYGIGRRRRGRAPIIYAHRLRALCTGTISPASTWTAR